MLRMESLANSMSWDSTKVFMDWNRLVAIGLQNSVMDFRIVALCKATFCIFFGSGCIVLTYVDDCIIVADTHDQINALIQSLHEGDKNFILQDKRLIDKYLRVDIWQWDASSFELNQPFLIKKITKFLEIDNGKINERLTPISKSLLYKDLDGVPRINDWEYWGAIGMLTYLTGSVNQILQLLFISVHNSAQIQCVCMNKLWFALGVIFFLFGAAMENFEINKFDWITFSMSWMM